jgi:ubiquinone/menaquinone biosynthesis C-methylase UbiE
MSFFALLGEIEGREQVLRHVAGYCSGRVLDVATGSGYLARKIRGSVVCLDIDANAVARLSDVVIGDARRMPFQSESFDVVATWSALAHIPEWHSAVAEMFRVARRLVITAEPKGKLALLAFRDFRCKHELSLEEVIAEFERFGRVEVDNFEFFTVVKGWKD